MRIITLFIITLLFYPSFSQEDSLNEKCIDIRYIEAIHYLKENKEWIKDSHIDKSYKFSLRFNKNYNICFSDVSKNSMSDSIIDNMTFTSCAKPYEIINIKQLSDRKSRKTIYFSDFNENYLRAEILFDDSFTVDHPLNAWGYHICIVFKFSTSGEIKRVFVSTVDVM